jgi:hypothetical protein
MNFNHGRRRQGAPVDGQRFDSLVQALGTAPNRRKLIKVLAGTAAAGITKLITPSISGAAVCRAPGEICRKHGDCCTNSCGPKDTTGRQRCQCRTATDCPIPSNKCLKATCSGGVCGTTPVICTALDQCYVTGTCNPTTGLCSNPPKSDGTACDDGDPCTERDVCMTGVCAGTSIVADGTTCETNEDCCGGVCVNGICQSACREAGQSCDEPADCCDAVPCVEGVCCPAQRKVRSDLLRRWVRV